MNYNLTATNRRFGGTYCLHLHIPEGRHKVMLWNLTGIYCVC